MRYITRVPSSQKVIFISLAIGLLVAGLSVFFQTRLLPSVVTYKFDAPLAEASSVAQSNAQIASTTTPQKDAGSGNTYEDPDRPMQLRISAIGVDAKIQSVGLTQKNTIGIPTNFTDVAWYNRGPKPGESGNAIIVGHLDGVKVERAVFYDLDLLAVGDVIEVTNEDGKVLQFKVTGTKIFKHDSDTAEIFSESSSKAKLILITCTGDWMAESRSYTDRLVVFSELVE